MSAKLLHFKVYEFRNTENEKINNEILFLYFQSNRIVPYVLAT